MIDLPVEALGALGAIIAWVFAILAIVLHVLFAVAVWRDAEKLTEAGRDPEFVTGAWWTVAVLIGGLLAVALYWAIHHSTLRRA